MDDAVILEQVEISYDAAGNVIQTNTRRRYHNAPDNQTGPLQDPATTPKSRVTYVASYPDALGRTIATADMGLMAARPSRVQPRLSDSEATTAVGASLPIVEVYRTTLDPPPVAFPIG